MTLLYVLVGERGEYDTFTREVYGVFSSEDEAKVAIPKLATLAAELWEKYQAHEGRRKKFLNTLIPIREWSPGSPFPSGHKQYSESQYAEAEKVCGAAPNFFCVADKYMVETFTLDAIQDH